MAEWTTRPLLDFVDPERSICYGIVQPGSAVSDGVPIVRVNNFVGGSIDTTDALQVDPAIEAKYRRSRLLGGELLITLVGSMGLTAIAPDKLRGWNVARAVGVVPLRADADKRWINFVVRSKPAQDFILMRANTTVQATFNLKDLAELPVPCPPATARMEMSAILSALDDKIELNRRMNETLEAMARAIFKDWFVDFGPTRAKIEGRAPYLAPDIWSLFPDRLDADGKPEGWETSTIGQEVDVVGGSTPSTKEPAFWDGEFSWATPKDLSSLSTPVLLKTERSITKAGLSEIGSGLLPVGTVLLSSRAPIGYLAIAQTPVAINQGFIAMVCRKRLSNVFVWLWTHANMETVHQKANGSTFQEISKANFRPIEVTIATPEILRAFDETSRPLFDRIISNEKESQTLAATRDLLLPKLMSGEVRVKDAEKSVGEAAWP
jgi:type I restriction enzyme S subunit